MTAIYGLVGNGDLSLLNAMGARLHHRGEVIREWSPASRVFLGQRGREEARTWFAQDHLSLVADATLFNAQEIASQLAARGWRCDSQNPLALIQRACAADGPDCFALFNGDFAVALWDEHAKRLILARDPLGGRMLYFWQGPDYVAFASEYKALLALEACEAVPDLAALQSLQQSKYLPSGRTLLAGVRSIPAAHWVEICDRNVAAHRYWDVALNPKKCSQGAAEQGLRERFLTAVARRVAGEGMPGAELSGGIDSAAVVAAMRRVRPDSPLKTFTIGTGPEDPEMLTARFVAEHLQTEHHEIFAGPECLPDVLPTVIWHLEDPIARTETVLYYLMMQSASEQIDVVLGGYASDGLYGGMPKHKLVKLMQLSPLGRRALEEFYHYTQVSAPPRSALGKIAKRLYFGGEELLAPTVLGAPFASGPSPLTGPRAGLLNRVLRDGILHGVPGWMPKVEKTHAAHGVELRSPFTDPDLIRYSFELPEHFKIRGLRDKYILRRALLPLLPKAVARRPKFPQRMDYGMQLSEVLETLAEQYLSPQALRQRGFFDPAEIAALRRRSVGKPYGFNRAMQLWTAIATELWARLFLDQRGMGPALGSYDGIPTSAQVLTPPQSSKAIVS